MKIQGSFYEEAVLHRSTNGKKLLDGAARMKQDSIKRQDTIKDMKTMPMKDRFTLYVRSNMRSVHRFSIKNMLQRWINDYRETEEKQAAIDVVRDWIHENKHLFKAA